jgi:hypothetical protein
MKNKLVLLIAVAAIAFIWLRSSGGGTTLADGSFLLYQQGEATVRLTFHLQGGDAYRTHVEITYGDGETEVSESMEGHGETVDRRMRKASGGVLELGSFGPLWVAPGQLKEGGSAYGSRVSEVRTFNGREVGVVSASVGIGGALRGEWYYDVATGFLVGGRMSTALSTEGQAFQLVESNIVGLAGG